jgi:hypothetical protein
LAGDCFSVSSLASFFLQVGERAAEKSKEEEAAAEAPGLQGMLAVSTLEKSRRRDFYGVCLVAQQQCDECAYSTASTQQGLDRMCEESNYEDFDVNKFMEGMK